MARDASKSVIPAKRRRKPKRRAGIQGHALTGA